MVDMWENNLNKFLITGLTRAFNTLIYLSRVHTQYFFHFFLFKILSFVIIVVVLRQSHCVVPDDLELTL